MNTSRSMFVVGAVGVLSACGGDATTVRFEERDSAGISILTSRAAAWDENEVWRMEPRPVLTLGEDRDDPERQFYLLTSGLLLDGGEFVVANSGSGELRWFDEQGQLLRTAGRAGLGPGEFEWIESLHSLGDSVLAYDSRLGRATVFGPSGQLVRTFAVVVPPGLPASDLMLWGGREPIAVFSGPHADSVGSSGKMVTTLAVYLTSSADGTYSDTIATAPGHELFLLGSGTGRPAGFRVPAFGLNEASATRSELFTRFATRGQLARYEIDGSLSGLIRWPHGDLTLSANEVRSELAEWLGDEASAARYDLPLPSARPSFGRLLFDDQGFLWVSEYAQYLREARSWLIFSPRLELLGRLTVPARFRVFDVRGDRVLGRRLGDFDEEIVELRQLVR